MVKKDPLKWLDADKKKTFQKHEDHLAKTVEGKKTPASGALNKKGDVQTSTTIYEAKSTDSRSLSLKLDWLEKVTDEALRLGKKPILSIYFSGAELPCQKQWFLVDEATYMEIFGDKK